MYSCVIMYRLKRRKVFNDYSVRELSMERDDDDFEEVELDNIGIVYDLRTILNQL